MSRRTRGGDDPAATFGNGASSPFGGEPDGSPGHPSEAGDVRHRRTRRRDAPPSRPFGGVIPGSRPSAVPGDQILIRGEAAARARKVDLVAGVAPGAMGAVGPWAEQLDDARATARDAGFAQGHEEGLAAGLEDARRHVEQQQADLAAAVQALLEELETRADDLGRQLADQTADLALEIAEAVLNQEIAAADDPGADAIARCLDLVPSSGCLVARLSPGDAASLGEVPGLGDRELVVAADPALSPGDAIVSVDQITVDARLSESLRRVGEALR